MHTAAEKFVRTSAARNTNASGNTNTIWRTASAYAHVKKSIATAMSDHTERVSTVIIKACGCILSLDELEKAAKYAQAHASPNETVTAVYVSPCYNEHATADEVYITWHVCKPAELVRLKEIES